ncbi:MAG: hypothetical protein LBL86_09475 [Coriobacteriales bacterium]|jgi:hypothetical protein|nr:hypothetical protein [Coriobacteriales bacterium]
MSITQISVFVENLPGRLSRLTDILEKADVSIRGFALADTADFGIARFVVDRPKEALAAFEAAGALTKTTELLCIELPDTPGALDQVFSAVADADVNVEYAYSLVSTYVALKVGDIAQAEALLAGRPVRLLAQDDLGAPRPSDSAPSPHASSSSL